MHKSCYQHALMKGGFMKKEKYNGEGKLAVITGASTGIGYELAQQFASHGFDLLITANESEIFNSQEVLRQKGVDVQSLNVDLSTSEGVQRLYQAILATGRPVYALVLNAGFAVSGDFVRENKLEDEFALIGLNITSVVHLAKLVLPDMVKRGEGRVLITSSIAALMPGPFYATYAASKSFLLSFSESLFSELKDSGVTVTALMPGATDTEFFVRSGMEGTKVAEASKDDPALVAKQGFEAMMAGDDHIIAGSFTNKLQGLTAKFLSEKMKASLHRRDTEPRSLH